MTRISQQGCMTLGQLAGLHQRYVPDRVLGHERARREIAQRHFQQYECMNERQLKRALGSAIQRARLFIANYRITYKRLPTAPQIMAESGASLAQVRQALREAR